jgi:hypothetical protein
MMTCPSMEEIAAFVIGSIECEERPRMLEHFAACINCRTDASRIQNLKTILDHTVVDSDGNLKADSQRVSGTKQRDTLPLVAVNEAIFFTGDKSNSLDDESPSSLLNDQANIDRIVEHLSLILSKSNPTLEDRTRGTMLVKDLQRRIRRLIQETPYRRRGQIGTRQQPET